MNCVKCGRETEDNVYTCLEIVVRNWQTQLYQAVTGIGRHAICDACVDEPLPRLLGDLFKKRRRSATESITYWYQLQHVDRSEILVTEKCLWPLEKDVLEAIAAEKKREDRLMKFIKTGRRLDVSMAFQEVVWEKFFEPGTWRNVLDGKPTDLSIEG